MLQLLEKLSRFRFRFEFDDANMAQALAKEGPSSSLPLKPTAHTKSPTEIHFDIVGLDALREKSGGNWHALQTHVHQMARGIITKYLRVGEQFGRVRAERYILILNRTDVEAQLVAKNICKELIEVFSRDENVHGQLQAALVNASLSTEAPKAVKPEHAKAESTLPPPTETTRRKSTSRPPMVRDEKQVGVMPSPLEYAYRAVWGMGSDRPSGVCLYPRFIMPDGGYLEGYDVLPEDADDDMILELDLRCLKRVHIAMKATHSSCGVATNMICPVHYKTINSRWRCERLADAFAALRADGLEEHITFQVMNMPRNLYGLDLKVSLGALKLLTSRIIAMTTLDRAQNDGLVNVGVTAVGVEFEGFAHMHLTPGQLKQKIQGYVDMARQEKISTFIFGVDTPDAMDLAEKYGFSHISGKSVTPEGCKGVSGRSCAESFFNMTGAAKGNA